MTRRLALALVAVVAACSSERAGWARRGSYWILDETPDLAIRRGAQVADPATGEIALAWVGARAPETSPPLLACELVVFEDRNGNRSPDAGEAVAARENLHVTRKILFDDVRVPARSGNALFARIVARTESGSRVVTWPLLPDTGR